MLPIRISGATRNLGAPKDWKPETSGPCSHLPIRDDLIDGIPYMTSRWEPTPDELADLIAGGPVELRILGVSHPVVSLVVQPRRGSRDVPHARCRNCGCFREPVRDPDLFDAPLPVPAVNDPFAAFHRESHRREALAVRRGVKRWIGAERRARYDFTHQSLRGTA